MFIIIFTFVGVGATITELIFYVIFFCHVIYHDNTIAITVVKRDIVRQRNCTNAISMAGLFATWVMEVSYFCWIIYFLTRSDSEQIREMLTIVKMSEFVVNPIVQILTSPALRKDIWDF